MAAILNLPSGFAQITAFFSGSPLPHGAAITFGIQVNPATENPGGVSTAVRDAMTATGSLWQETAANWVNLVHLTEVLCKFGPLATGPSSSDVRDTAIGNIAGEAYSPNCAVLVSKVTATGGRRGRGRWFLPGISESLVIPGGQLLAGVQSTLATRAASFLAALTTQNHPMYLLHRHDPALGQSPVAPTEVIQLGVANLLATQRRRLRN